MIASWDPSSLCYCIRFHSTDGWIGNTGWRAPLRASSQEILDAKTGEEEVHLYTSPAGEHPDFLDCVKSRKDPNFPVDIGHCVAS